MGSASTIWKGISPALERLFDVITFDLPGHGKTPYDPGQAMDPASLADLVVANMDSLDIQKAHFVGNSLGGWVGLEIASRHPGRVFTFTGLAPAGLILTPYTKINPITAQSRQIAVLTHSIQKYLLRFMWAKKLDSPLLRQSGENFHTSTHLMQPWPWDCPRVTFPLGTPCFTDVSIHLSTLQSLSR